MKLIFTIAGLQPEFGGPSRSVARLAVALAQAGAQVELLTCDSLPGQPAPLLPPRDLVATRLLPPSSRTTRWLPGTNAFAAVLEQRCRIGGPVVIHDHGLWLPNNHATAFAAQRAGAPRIVSPRGMLSAWALQHKSWKKRIAWWLYQRRDLQSATVLHATAPAEAAEFRAVGLRQPIAVIPNGVELPTAAGPKDDWTTSQQDHEVGGPSVRSHVVLFMGRLHPKKGLLNLVRAWAAVRRTEDGGQRSAIRHPTTVVRPQDNWRVVIAGNDEGGHLEDVKAEVRRLKAERDFEFVGPVEGEAKWNLYREADLFVLPSHSENFGIVVAEALACGVPVITTKATPWEDLETHRCGWWTELGSEPLAETLREAMSRTDEDRREMGRRGRALVEAKYGWPSAAQQMLAVYEWMIGRASRPACVIW